MSEGDDSVDGTDSGDDSPLPGGATRATPAPTAQSSALRRQQLLAGLLVAYGIVKLVTQSIFPGEAPG